MSTFATGTTDSRAVSTSAILGQVCFLVAVALAFLVAGTFMGRELATGAARACSFAGLGMLIVTWFVPALRRGALGIGWLCGLALLFGLGVAPLIAYLTEVQPGTVSTAAGLTALTVLGMGATGFVMEKDTARWMRPLSLAVLACVVVSLGALAFGGLGTLSPILSIVIIGLSAALILVDFNYVRKHATEDDVVWLATGIFVSIINIFFSLLNILSD